MTETINDTKTFTIGITPPPTPAEGEIVSYDVPENTDPYDSFPITVTVKNTGGSDGSFKLKVYINDEVESVAGPANIAAGESKTWTLGVTTPSTGTSLSGKLELVSIT